MEETHALPTVSRVLDDGRLIELVFDARTHTTALACAWPDGRLDIETAIDLAGGRRLVPYSPTNDLIAKDCVLLPSAVGVFTTKVDLLDEIAAFIHQYVDLSPTFEAIAAHYVLLSWVYDAFGEVPYLRLRGDFGTGKTRALHVLGRLCYKPFFASGASTVSPIFHILEEFAGTLMLDEADFRSSDATAELTKILNNGSTRGMPLLRTMTNRNRELHPKAFRVFGPKVIAMRGSFADVALESRFITENTGGRPLRADIPITLPNTFPKEALALRNKLLAFRFASFHDTAPDPTRLDDGLSPRARQTVLPLLSVIDDPVLREAVCGHVGVADSQLRKEQSVPVQQLMLAAILAAFDREGSAGATIAVITQLFNQDAAHLLGKPVNNRWVGSYVRKTFGVESVKSHGTFAIPLSARQRFLALTERIVAST